MGDEKGRYSRFYQDASTSLWFGRFVEGCSKRMGQITKRNRAMSTDLLKRMLEEIETNVEGTDGHDKRHRWVVFGAFVTISYVVSLRGTEGFLLDLRAMNKYWTTCTEYTMIALLGRVKGEGIDRNRTLPSVNETKSGVRVRDAVGRLLDLQRAHGRTNGPAITDPSGTMYTSADLNSMFAETLEPIFDSERHLFPPDMERDEITSSFQVFRTLRKTSDSRAIDEGVDRTDIDTVNRWRRVEGSGGRRPAMEMIMHYADLRVILKPFLRYTGNM
jgi:hypothetical protein